MSLKSQISPLLSGVTPPSCLRASLTRRQAVGLLLGGLTAGCAGPRYTPDGRVLLRYMAWGDPQQMRVERRVADAFEKHYPHIRVQIVTVPPSHYAEKLQLMLASHTATDVMRVDRFYFQALAEKEYFLPLEPFIAREPAGFLDDFLPITVEECRQQDSIQALNVLFGPVLLYYNKALFQIAGLPDPYALYRQGRWTWDAFVEAAQRLTKREGGRPVQFGSTMPTFPLYASIVWNHGGDFMDAGQSHLILDTPTGIRGMEEVANLRWKYQCAPTPADGALSAFTFESGKIAMHWGWAGESPRFRRNIHQFAWDIVPTPSGPTGDATVVKGNQLVISRETAFPKEAWEFVKFVTGPEAELLLYGELRRCTPTRRALLNDPRYLQATLPPFQTDVFVASVRRGRTLPIGVRYMEWQREYGAATEGLFNIHSETAEEACRAATRRVNALLASEAGF